MGLLLVCFKCSPFGHEVNLPALDKTQEVKTEKTRKKAKDQERGLEL